MPKETEWDTRAQDEYRAAGYLVFGAVGPLDVHLPISGPDIHAGSTATMRATSWGIVAETTREEYMETGMRFTGRKPPAYTEVLTHFYRVVALD